MLGKPVKKPILIDVDGVLANFVEPVIDYINDRFDKNYIFEDTIFDVRKLAGDSWDAEAEDFIKKQGFALNLNEYPNSIKVVNDLFSKHNVIFVTSPYKDSPTWCHERMAWLNQRINGFSRDHIIFARDKRYIDGFTLVDDRTENILDWAAYNNKYPILMIRPWNKSFLNEECTKEGHDSKQPFSWIRHKYPRYQHRKTGVWFFALDDWNKIRSLIETLFDIYKQTTIP